MDSKSLNEVRKRSVDNLQRLYTVVVSLAVTEALRRTLVGLSGDQTDSPATLDQWLMLLSLIATVVPFYHGANRYLDATYVTKERSAKSNVLMVDFLLLFLEGGTFFALAMLIKRLDVFYTVLAVLLLFDALWVMWTRVPAADQPEGAPGFGAWAIINLVAAAVILIFVWSSVLDHPFWPTSLARSIALAATAVVRSIVDYKIEWDFYFPAPRLDSA